MCSLSLSLSLLCPSVTSGRDSSYRLNRTQWVSEEKQTARLIAIDSFINAVLSSMLPLKQGPRDLSEAVSAWLNKPKWGQKGALKKAKRPITRNDATAILAAYWLSAPARLRPPAKGTATAQPILPISRHNLMRSAESTNSDAAVANAAVANAAIAAMTMKHKTEVTEKKWATSFQAKANNKRANKRMKTFTIYISAQQFLAKQGCSVQNSVKFALYSTTLLFQQGNSCWWCMVPVRS